MSEQSSAQRIADLVAAVRNTLTAYAIAMADNDPASCGRTYEAFEASEDDVADVAGKMTPGDLDLIERALAAYLAGEGER